MATDRLASTWGSLRRRTRPGLYSAILFRTATAILAEHPLWITSTGSPRRYYRSSDDALDRRSQHES